MTKLDKDFDILVGHLLWAYEQFCLNQVMHEMVKGDEYRKFVTTWDMVLVSLEIGYLLELAKIFEKPISRPEDTISIYYFLDYEFKDYGNTIEKLKILRNKLLTHIDVNFARNPEESMKKIGLQTDEVSALFDKTIEVIDKLKVGFGVNQDLKSYFQDAKVGIRNRFGDFIKQFISTKE